MPEGGSPAAKNASIARSRKACGIERRNLPFQDNAVDPQFAAEIRDLALELGRTRPIATAAKIQIRTAAEPDQDPPA